MLVDLWTANGQVGNHVDAFIGKFKQLFSSDVFGACIPKRYDGRAIYVSLRILIESIEVVSRKFAAV